METSDIPYIGNRLLIFSVIIVPVQVSFVALRYWVRWLIKSPWGADDLIILFSLFCQLCLASVCISAVKHAGVGYHQLWIEADDPLRITIWGKHLFAISLITYIGVNTPKLAILVLYKRLFPNKGLHHIIHVLMAVLVLITIALIVIVFTACRPLAANWSMIPGSHCIDREAVYLYGSVPNIVTDVIMLILPMQTIWNLHANKRLKIGLTVTFAFASFGLVTSVIRFTTFHRTNSFTDGTWNAVQLLIWTQVESGVYLISACIPTYRPLLERIRKGGFLKRLVSRKTSKDDADPSHRELDIQLQQQRRLSAKSQGKFHRLAEGMGDSKITVTKDFTFVENHPGDENFEVLQTEEVKRSFNWAEPS